MFKEGLPYEPPQPRMGGGTMPSSPSNLIPKTDFSLAVPQSTMNTSPPSNIVPNTSPPQR